MSTYWQLSIAPLRPWPFAWLYGFPLLTTWLPGIDYILPYPSVEWLALISYCSLHQIARGHWLPAVLPPFLSAWYCPPSVVCSCWLPGIAVLLLCASADCLILLYWLAECLAFPFCFSTCFLAYIIPLLPFESDYTLALPFCCAVHLLIFLAFISCCPAYLLRFHFQISTIWKKNHRKCEEQEKTIIWLQWALLQPNIPAL